MHYREVFLAGPFMHPVVVCLDLSECDPVLLFFSDGALQGCSSAVILPDWFLVTLRIFAFYCHSLHFCLNRISNAASSLELIALKPFSLLWDLTCWLWDSLHPAVINF